MMLTDICSKIQWCQHRSEHLNLNLFIKIYLFFFFFQATFKGWTDIMYAAVDSRDVSRPIKCELIKIRQP